MRRLIRTGMMAGMVGVVAWAASCGGGDDGTGPDSAQIQATVRVDGSARSGVPVGLFAVGGTTALEEGTTNSSGVVLFRDLQAGSYEIEIVVPSETELESGETARKPVTATAGQTATVTFDLAAVVSGDVVQVTLNATSFSPAERTIAPGTTVRWVNGGSVFHTITPDGHTEWSRATVSNQGDTFEHTFDTAGTFPYFCEPHLNQGMTGTITVQ